MAQCEQCGRQLPPFSFRKICRWCVQHKAAQRGDDSAFQRVETAPWLRQQSSSMAVTQVIFGANVAVFLAMTLAIGASMLSGPQGLQLVHWGANYGPRTVSGEWWRLLTCVFLHGSLLHIAFNMWCLWDLGRLAESLYGHWTFATVYLICGLAASLASIAWTPGVLSVGASGAIFGIAGALISSFYLGEFSLPRAALGGTLRSLLIFAGYNLFFGAVIARTDNAAHVGGLVMGLTLGALIARVAPVHGDVVRRIAVLLVGAAMVAGGVMWLQHARSYMVHAQKGVELLNEGEPDEAVAELRKTVSQRPDFAPGHEALARAYISKHDFDSAAAEMTKAIALRPRDEGARYGLGLIYLEQKQPAKAQDAFTELLKLNPNSADGHAGLASALSDQRRDTEALAEYQRAAAINSNYQGVNYNIGLEQARLQLYDEAIASLLKQREAGDDHDNESLLADVYTTKGMLKEAADARQRAAQLSEQK
jgi:membrane associated rhomboid family serine protease/Tfp pilus assembly protein PilF